MGLPREASSIEMSYESFVQCLDMFSSRKVRREAVALLRYARTLLNPGETEARGNRYRLCGVAGIPRFTLIGGNHVRAVASFG